MSRYLVTFNKAWEVIDTKSNCEVMAEADNRQEAIDLAIDLNREEEIKLVAY